MFQIKSYYNNSTIYNYKSKNVHSRLGIAKASFEKYVAILLANKDAVVINGNLTVLRLCDPFRTKKAQWVRPQAKNLKNKSVSDTVIYINSLLFRFEAAQQEYLISLKERSSKGVNPKSLTELKSAKGADKVIEKMGFEWDAKDSKYSIHKEVNFSIIGISEKLNISVYKTYKMLNHLKKRKMICSISNIIPKRYFKGIKQSVKTSSQTFISKNGNEFVCLPNTYRFSNTYTI